MHYRPAPKDDDALRLALIRLAKQYGRYGYRKVGELLAVEGWRANHKKVERIWREEGLQLPHRHKKRRRLYHHDASVIRLRSKYPNHVWAIDFVHDKLSNGRPYKMLTVIDEYTREALCVAVAPRMGSADVLEALYPLLLKRGKPEYIRSDNGPEFVVAPLQEWLTKVGIKPIHIYPGSPLSALRSNTYRAVHGRMGTTNGSTERCAGRSSMLNGLRVSTRLEPSSTNGSDSTITSAHTRHSTCARPCPKL